jgi:hypothetical protein
MAGRLRCDPSSKERAAARDERCTSCADKVMNDLLTCWGGVARIARFFAVRRNGIGELAGKFAKNFFGLVRRRNGDAQLVRLN